MRKQKLHIKIEQATKILCGRYNVDFEWMDSVFNTGKTQPWCKICKHIFNTRLASWKKLK